MDANKLVKLKVIGYQVRKTCGNCIHALFSSPASDWGTCWKHQYEHLKHTGEARQLSIHRSGHCDDHHRNKTLNLGGFEELVEK